MEPAVARRETYRRNEGSPRRQLSKRARSNAEPAGAGEFVRLAAAIDGCAAFNPKQWRQVLDTSTTVLRHRKSDGILNTGSLSTDGKKRVERGDKRTVTQRPLSRDEDTVASFEETTFPPLSVTQYLNQPDMVKEILREADDSGDKDQGVKDEIEEHEVLVEPQFQVEEHQNDGDVREMKKNVLQDEERQTDGENTERTEAPYVVLPLLTTISPRTRRGLAHLPPPCEAEMREIESFTRSVDHSEFSEDFYRELKRKRIQQAHRQNTVAKVSTEKTELQKLPSSQVSSVRKTKGPRGTIKPLTIRKETDAREAKLLTVPVEAAARAQKVNEQKQMEKEFTGRVVKTSNQQLPSSKNKVSKRSRSYSRLIQERNVAELQHGAAESQLDWENLHRQLTNGLLSYCFALEFD
ncbi:hypothetical protein PC128_g18064 [Phytophthora cactorum]|nr:hypothetical protein PC120_g17917 [Phytophthora cactorum]KAG3098722.1 hypothetical protein PC121_g2044 [Phytophthora cactorum]KAG3174347.1 hypothetical protein PC128_g18064 [Phytophthora cactorum]KAG4048965.1 hypothetical protein PC123_g15732 [Phytophthora cactorum]